MHFEKGQVMNKNFKKILAVALTLTILLVSVVTLSGCNFFRKNNIYKRLCKRIVPVAVFKRRDERELLL